MSTSTNYHCHKGDVRVRWSNASDAAIFEMDDGEIAIFAHTSDLRDRLKRAVEAFATEMQREPVAQQAAE